MHTRFPFFNQEILTAATFSVKTQQQAAAPYAYVRTPSQDSYWVRSALNKTYTHRYRWPRGFPAARWLRLWVRNPLGTLLSASWMLCFRIEISALGRSLFQGSRTKCVCVCVCVCGCVWGVGGWVCELEFVSVSVGEWMSDCVCVCVCACAVREIRCKNTPIRPQWVGRRGQTKKESLHSLKDQLISNDIYQWHIS